ncbi:MAG: hypothetical protein HY824_15930, partial [Acidobacteria bacterium]|nr:hypothetical protein [Acidobacteriota bacterium]
MSASRRLWTIVGGALLAAALAVVAARPLFFQDPAPQIHVRWRTPLDAAARDALERRFHLVPAEEVGPDIWRYELTDPSRDSVEALVRHPAVADTHYIDRDTFEIREDAPRARRRPTPLGEYWPEAAGALVDTGPIVLLLLAAVAARFAVRPHEAPAIAAFAVRVFTRAIPLISPRTLALFRLVFGLALAWYAFALRLDYIPLPVARTNVPLAHFALMAWLGQHPSVVHAGLWTAIVSSVLFAAGVLPKVLYVVSVAGITQWLLTATLWHSSHPYGVLLLPLVCLIAVPWGDAPPIARFLGRHPPPAGTPARRYGYAPWLLSLALGLAWAGAAWAKVGGGPAWVLNGSIRYHFVTDIEYAPVPWGLTIAAMPNVAVALSAGAVLVEGLLVLAAVLVTAPLLRLLAGAAALSVLAGFYLFMGLFWPAWWILLLGFLPWQWCDRGGHDGAAAVAAARVTRGQIWCAAGLALQQLIVSAVFIDLEPVASRYDMYSRTYPS